MSKNRFSTAVAQKRFVENRFVVNRFTESSPECNGAKDGVEQEAKGSAYLPEASQVSMIRGHYLNKGSETALRLMKAGVQELPSLNVGISAAVLGGLGWAIIVASYRTDLSSNLGHDKPFAPSLLTIWRLGKYSSAWSTAVLHLSSIWIARIRSD
ncbi:hypothetical protein K445DRAFT_374107 [Daldinia sp. EC12]|nr:hypothetical protein K445DRAFT_374107 [Daldinia sp. EC12]